ncbi:MAG: helix-turn-helix transcriptional regulator [Lawsonibacter sp.]
MCKILLDSRSMPKDEMEPILDKLLSRCASPQSRKLLGQILANERFYYVEPYHGKRLSNQLWTLGQAIWSHSVVEAVYRTQQGERKSRRLQPVGLLFSEFYFYLTAFIEGIDRAEHFENADDPFPTIYRVDRIEKLQVLDEHFQVPYSRRFSEGSSGSGSSSCTAGNWKRCVLSIKGHPWRRYWTGSPRRRYSVSTTDAMRSARRSLARALKCG